MFPQLLRPGTLGLWTSLILAVSGCTPASAPLPKTDVITPLERPVKRITQTSTSVMDHSHMPVTLPEGVPVPTLSIAVSRDWMSGLNLEIFTENYVLMAPPNALNMDALMAPSIDAETGYAAGHAHLYVNGVKIQRIYGSNLHLPADLFKPGLNQINVSINNHGHMYWMAGGRQIIATLYLDLNQDEMVKHRFESYPAVKTADGSLCSNASLTQEG